MCGEKNIFSSEVQARGLVGLMDFFFCFSEAYFIADFVLNLSLMPQTSTMMNRCRTCSIAWHLFSVRFCKHMRLLECLSWIEIEPKLDFKRRVWYLL